ncbi:restriction endonuclease subunit S [Peptoniphilus harei]|uniref:restriction endonuclease subunit S n=1 Tax=Peptoniphilus harei TaxID=54005 RepID=UPI0028FE1F12|nr:restriction endonuclease subunit S [Peptoniphilus harei]MDU1643130.1 restriction endonuclease subunit S [Peptoniphilus harei]
MKGLKEIASRNNWDLKLISDVVFFQEGPGVRKHQYTSRGVKLLNVTNILDGYLDLEATDRYISEEEAYGKYKHFLVDEGDLLIACSGIKISYFDKKITFVSSEDLPLCMNTSTMRFKTNNENKLNIKYFYYFLKSNYFKKQLARQITGSAQLNFGPSHIKKMFIMIPEIEYQKILAKILDKITKLIEIRRKQIQAYDNLIESIFFEMFKKYKTESVNLGDLFELKSGSTPSRKNNEYWNKNDVPWIKSNQVNNNFIFNTEEYISQEGYKNSSLEIYPEDTVLIAMYGQGKTRGQVGILKFESTTNQAVAALIPNKISNMTFIFYLLKTKYEELRGLSQGGNQKNLSLKILKNFKIFNPPIEIQNKFAEYVIKIEEEKKKLNSSLKELEDLFDALMQDAFSGNLFKD